MRKHSTNLIFLKEKKELHPDHLSSEKVYKHIRKYIGFQHIRIDEKTSVAAFESIWREFMKFTEECRYEIPKDHHRRLFQYTAAFDMPIALMPDGGA